MAGWVTDIDLLTRDQKAVNDGLLKSKVRRASPIMPKLTPYQAYGTPTATRILAPG
jgi:hypothetical protein